MKSYNGSRLSQSNPLKGLKFIVLPALDADRVSSVVFWLPELPGGLCLPFVMFPFEFSTLEVLEIFDVPIWMKKSVLIMTYRAA